MRNFICKASKFVSLVAVAIFVGINGMSKLVFAESAESAWLLKSISSSKSLNPAVNPLPDRSLDTILPLEEFLKLSINNKQLYLYAVQSLILEIQADDINHHVQYDSMTAAQIWWLPQAFAGEGDRRCIFAGWISHLNSRGSCENPDRITKTCPAGNVSCQPALFGFNSNGKLKCFAANANATSMCAAGVSPAQVASRFRTPEGRQAWADYRAALKGYCDQPVPTQQQVCRTINRRLLQVSTAIGQLPKPRYPAQAAGGDRSMTPRTIRADAVTNKTQPSDQKAETVIKRKRRSAPKTAVKNVDTESIATDEETDKASEISSKTTKCQPAALLANLIKTGDKDYRFHKYDPLVSTNNLMDLGQAKAMMCGNHELELGFAKHYRERLEEFKKTARSDPGGDGPKERSRNKTIDARNFSQISSNFEACLAEAQENRKSGRAEFAGRSATIVYEGPHEGYFTLKDANGKRLSEGPPTYYEELFITFGISICNIQTKTTDSNAHSQSQSPQVPVAPAAAAQ